MQKMQDIEQLPEVLSIYDNKGYTKDNYTIQLLYDNGDTFLITTNRVASIWNISENMYIDIDALDTYSMFYDEEFYNVIGEEILWEDLPEELRLIVNSYFQ